MRHRVHGEMRWPQNILDHRLSSAETCVGNRNTILLRMQNNRTVLLSLAVVVDEKERGNCFYRSLHIPRMDRESEYAMTEHKWHTICSEMMQFIESNPFTALIYTAPSSTTTHTHTIQSTSFVWLLFNRQNEHFHHIKLTLDLCGQWLHFCTNSIALCSQLNSTAHSKPKTDCCLVMLCHSEPHKELLH